MVRRFSPTRAWTRAARTRARPLCATARRTSSTPATSSTSIATTTTTCSPVASRIRFTWWWTRRKAWTRWASPVRRAAARSARCLLPRIIPRTSGRTCAIPRCLSTTACTTWCLGRGRATTAGVCLSICPATSTAGGMRRGLSPRRRLATCGSAPTCLSSTASCFSCAARRAWRPRGGATTTLTSAFGFAWRRTGTARALGWSRTAARRWSTLVSIFMLRRRSRTRAAAG